MTISAKIIAHSNGMQDQTIITFELEYPRFIHAELMTHRAFSRNAASSRAIPVKRAIALIRENTAMPIHWGKNQPGMSAKEECNELVGSSAHAFGASREGAWNHARDKAIIMAEAFDEAGYHKQIVNRILEPYSHIKVVVTSTEWNNWFGLRKHPDAMPEICELARKMDLCRKSSTAVQLQPGEWHVPYYKDGYWKPFMYNADTDDPNAGIGCTLHQALCISSSCCAQVSYRRLDDSVEKATEMYERLVTMKPVHASPFEHQATPVGEFENWSDGITHVDRSGNWWSGNFKNWIQHRQLILDNVIPG